VRIYKKAMEKGCCRPSAKERLSSEIQSDKKEETLKVEELAITSGEDIQGSYGTRMLQTQWES